MALLKLAEKYHADEIAYRVGKILQSSKYTEEKIVTSMNESLSEVYSKCLEKEDRQFFEIVVKTLKKKFPSLQEKYGFHLPKV